MSITEYIAWACSFAFLLTFSVAAGNVLASVFQTWQSRREWRKFELKAQSEAAAMREARMIQAQREEWAKAQAEQKKTRKEAN